MELSDVLTIILASGVTGTLVAGVFTMITARADRQQRKGIDDAEEGKLLADQASVYAGAAINLINEVQEDNRRLRVELETMKVSNIQLRADLESALVRITVLENELEDERNRPRS